MTHGAPHRDGDIRPQPLGLFRNLVTSTGIGALAYVITDVLIGRIGERQVWVITLSLLIGAVVFLTQFLHDMHARIGSVESADAKLALTVERLVDDRLTRISDEVRRGFIEINEATELFGLVEASPLRTGVMTQLVRHATQIPPDAPALLHRFAQAEIGRTSELLKELSEFGNITYDGEDRDWLLALARNVEASIDATSLTTVDAAGNGLVDGGRWSSDLGQRYLEAQGDAVARGVRVRRLFIVDRAALAGDAMFLDVCGLHTDLGAAVRVLDASGVPATRRSSLFDFILFDDAVSYETTPASTIDGTLRPTIVNTRLELRASRVRDRIERFRGLWECARELDS